MPSIFITCFNFQLPILIIAKQQQKNEWRLLFAVYVNREPPVSVSMLFLLFFEIIPFNILLILIKSL